MTSTMANYYDSAQSVPYAYQPVSPATRVRKIVGTTMMTGMVGMCAYYLPVSKDSFTQTAFDIKKNDAAEQIATLKNIAEEIDSNKLTTQSKMILNDMALAEDVNAISAKCSELEKSVTDPANVKALKNEFRNNFDSYKKNVALMDNTCAQAFKNIKWSRFRWGMGIGAAIGLASGLVSGRD